MDVRDNRLLLGGCEAEALAGDFGTPLYVYEEEVIRGQCRLFRESFAAAAPDIHYAMKANFNPAILAIVRHEGLFIDAVSPFEVRLALEVGFPPEQILFTGNNTSEEELRFCLERGVPLNVGSLTELERFGRLSPGGRVGLRINPDVGAGHHNHVITGGPHSKFGIYHTEVETIGELLRRHDLRLVGIHSHIGTGILEPAQMLAAMEIILATVAKFEGLEFVDFGERFRAFRENYGRPLKMKLEPGRFIVGPAGTLLARVTAIHATPAHTFVGTDTGFNHLLRPALYAAYHEIVNASAVEGQTQTVAVAGNICESGDVLTHGPEGLEDRALTRPEVGHLLAIRDAGAYGMAQASNYNLRPRPAEVMVTGGKPRLVRQRETFEEMVGQFPDF